jgi:UDP-2,4-diacetamido-2,4,6-trideoxy-beta-L-altropyranose hydrolase
MFRFEGNANVGYGHAMRCLALAQQLIDQGHACSALTVASAPSDLDAWMSEKRRVNSLLALDFDDRGIVPGGDDDADVTLQSCAKFNADWLVLDNYAFGRAFQQAMMHATAHRLYLDDADASYVGADIVLNQNARIDGSCRLDNSEGLRLLGLRYFLARRELQSIVDNTVDRGARDSVLVTMGGADRANIGLKVCETLHPLLPEDCRIILACTADEHGWQTARAFAATRPNVEVRLRPELPALMAQASVTICGGGVTSVELASAGIACVIMITADNQRAGAQALAAQGCVRLAGDAGAAARIAADLLMDAQARQRLSERARALIDMGGAARVAAEMTRQCRRAPS